MANAVLRITGRHQGTRPDVPELVTATIFEPEETGDGDFACRVSIPALYEEDRFIFGVDENHAQEVSAFFVRNLFEGLRITVAE